MVGYNCYREKESWINGNKTGRKLEGAVMLIVTPFVLIKDRNMEPFLVILNTCLSLSWPV
jgi:hypothetical protein